MGKFSLFSLRDCKQGAQSGIITDKQLLYSDFNPFPRRCAATGKMAHYTITPAASWYKKKQEKEGTTMYRIDIMTLFPDVVGDMLCESILGRAQERGFIRIECHQIRTTL